MAVKRVTRPRTNKCAGCSCLLCKSIRSFNLLNCPVTEDVHIERGSQGCVSGWLVFISAPSSPQCLETASETSVPSWTSGQPHFSGLPEPRQDFCQLTVEVHDCFPCLLPDWVLHWWVIARPFSPVLFSTLLLPVQIW